MTRSTSFGASSAAAAFASLTVFRAGWLPALLVAAFWAAPSLAADRWTYCFGGTCHDRLSDAEAALRATQPGWQYMVVDDITSSEDASGEFVTRTYAVEAQPPIVETPYYYSNGTIGGFRSEAEVIADVIARNVRVYQGCTYSETIVGSHVFPYTFSTSWGAIGFTDLRNGGANAKRVVVDFNCGGGPGQNFTPIQVTSTYTCPAGMFRTDSHAPGFHEIQGGVERAFDDICVVHDRPTITSRAVPVECEKGNCNPTYPGTGDKARFEPDLEFAGRSIVRSYHSMMQGLPANEFAPGWTVTFSERAKLASGRATVFSDRGYLEVYESTGDGVNYRSVVRPERVFRVLPDRWQRIEADGEIREYDLSTGRLIRVFHPADAANAITLAYDGTGRLQTATTALGRQLTYVYTDGRLTALQVTGGDSVVYGYDAQDNLQTVTRADASVRTYHYAEAGLALSSQVHLLTGITDENGDRFASFGYDARGRTILSRLHTGIGGQYHDETTLTYAADGSVTLTNANGGEVDYTFTPDGSAQTASRVTARGTVSYQFDAQGRRIEKIDEAGVRTTYGYPDVYTTVLTEAVGTAEERRTTVVRDGLRRVATRSVDARSGANWVAVASERRVHDAAGRLAALCLYDPDSPNASYACGSMAQAPSGVRQATYTYCTAADAAIVGGTCPIEGLPKSIDGPSSEPDTVTFRYRPSDDLAGCGTSSGNCHRKGDLHEVLDAFGRATRVRRYDLAGRPAEMEDVNGVVARLEYDDRGRVTARTVLGATSATDARTIFDYDDVGQVEKVTSPDGTFVSFDYDAAHRLVGIEDALGNTITYSLDAAGHSYQDETRDAGGVLTAKLSRLFDELGQLETSADAYANATEFTYDAGGNLDTATDALGRTTDNAHDALGRLRESIANVAGTGSQRAQSQFGYDALDRLTSVIDPKGLTTTYDYDAFGNLLALVSPDTGTTTNTYDIAGNLETSLDARGVLTTYDHDRLGRLTLIDRPSAGQDATFTFDTVPTACLAGETFGIGRLGTMSDPSGNTQFCYDRRGNLVRKVQAVTGAAASRTVRYGYNLADAVMTMTYPSGASVTYTRDATGRISGVTAKPSSSAATVTIVSDVDYLPFGPIGTLTFGNGRTLTKSYDQNYGIDAVADSATGGVSLDLGLNDVGNVVAIDERLVTGATAARTVTYDGLDRLTGLVGGATHTFQYDATGNRTKRNSSVYTYDTDSHHLTKVGSVVRDYDAVGNTTVHTASKSYTYDDAGRMAQYLNNGVVSREFVYNARGERVGKKVPGSPGSDTYFVYDEAGHLIGEYRGSGSRVREYVWLDDVPVAVFASHAGTTYQYILTDHLNTPRAVALPTTDTIVWRWDLTGSAFGDHAVAANPDGDANSYTLPLRYPGQYHDTETGLFQNYFRDYDPATGRYVQSDPIGLAGGASTYGYVGGGPLAGADPLGLFDVVARYSCAGTCGYQYQFNFQSTMGEVRASRGASTARSMAAKAGGGLASLLALSQRAGETFVAASPAGMSDIAMDPLAELFGETLLEQCATADGEFERLYNSSYGSQDWLSEDQALDLLEQFRIQQNAALMNACRAQPASCRVPFHDVMDFYGLRDPHLPGNHIPRVLVRAQGRMDSFSNSVRAANPPGG